MKTASNPPVQERGEKKIEEELMHDGGDDVYAPIIPDSIYSIYFISSPSLSLSLSLSLCLSLSFCLSPSDDIDCDCACHYQMIISW